MARKCLLLKIAGNLDINDKKILASIGKMWRRPEGPGVESVGCWQHRDASCRPEIRIMGELYFSSTLREENIYIAAETIKSKYFSVAKYIQTKSLKKQQRF
jgi:hypothetical protein